MENCAISPLTQNLFRRFPQVSAGFRRFPQVPRFCVRDEKRPKQYIKREKSTFDEKNLKLLHGRTNFPHFIGKKISSKTSSDRLKLLYKTKKLLCQGSNHCAKAHPGTHTIKALKKSVVCTYL
jgi:hypothetical protein